MEYHGVLLVTAKNHAWAAEEAGLTREEVQKAYDAAMAKDEVCVLPRKK